ncbi:hypothetical protein Gotur_026671 [Gossypium turneri]
MSLKINSMVRFLKENNSTHLEMIHMKGIRDYVGFRSRKVSTSLSQHLQMCLKKMAQNQTLLFWLGSGVDRLWMRSGVRNVRGICCFPNW